MDRDYYSDSMMMVKPSRKASNAGSGKSAYEIWLDEGHTGSEADFLKSLQGEGFDPSACTLSLHTDGLLYMFYHGQPMGNGIALPSGSSGDVVGNVDSENNIIVQGKLPDGTYTVKYEMEDGTTVDIGDFVIGDSTAYTNLADPTSSDWKEGYRLSISSGSTSALAGHTVTNFIPCKAGDVLRVKGLKMVGSIGGDTDLSDYAKIVMYNSSKTKLGGLYGSTDMGDNSNYGLNVTTDGDVSTLTVLFNNEGTQVAPSTCASICIDGGLLSGYTKNDVIITINEEITD